MQIKLKTSQDMCDKANNIDYNLTHEEKRLSLWVKITDKIKEVCIKIRF